MAVLTVRVGEDLKRKIKQYKIPISEVARTAIAQAIERREREEALRAIRRAREILRSLDVKGLTRDIREGREAR